MTGRQSPDQDMRFQASVDAADAPEAVPGRSGRPYVPKAVSEGYVDEMVLPLDWSPRPGMTVRIYSRRRVEVAKLVGEWL